ncbi:MAG: class I SAM-dependent methyltransferase [Candidatus Hodarchaeota archaeon]
MTNEEYNRFWFAFEGIRAKIADILFPYGLQKAKWILDVPAGHGLLAHEIALRTTIGQVIGLGLRNDARDFKATQRLLEFSEGLGNVTYVQCDATKLSFGENCFDFIVNFLGLEDIHMTRGEKGLSESFTEFTRILRPGGILQIAVSIIGDEPDEILSQEITEYIGHKAIFKKKEFFKQQFEKNGIQLLKEKWLYSQKKLTAEQAAEELQFACEQTPKTFQDFEVKCRSFKEVWEKFSERIQEIGMAYYSDICVLIGQKID